MRLRTVHYNIKIPAHLDPPVNPVTLVMVSDLHGAYYGRDQAQLMEMIDRVRPAAVLSAGDLVTAKAGTCETEAAAEFVEIASGKYPFYFVNGNHETRMDRNRAQYGDAFDRYMKEIEKTGAVNVTNTSADPKLGGMKIHICGYEANMACYSRIKRSYPGVSDIQKTLGDCPRDRYTIMLSHHPDFFPMCAKWGADLTLSGHFHGGTVRLPFLGGVIGGSLIPFPKYDRGMFTLGDKTMVVSGGLGAHTIKLRVNNPPQLVAIHLSGDMKTH